MTAIAPGPAAASKACRQACRVRRVGHEVQHGPVGPDLVVPLGRPAAQAGDQPADLRRCVPKQRQDSWTAAAEMPSTVTSWKLRPSSAAARCPSASGPTTVPASSTVMCRITGLGRPAARR
ncbi:MAG: hypothetical protein ACLPKI_07100 [Streptosporangiaceae bacterium]